MKKLTMLLLVCTILSGCSDAPKETQNNNPEADEVTTLTEQSGIIGMVDAKNQRILLVPDMKKEDLKGKSKAEIGELAKEQDGAWYHTESSKFSQGQRVRVIYDSSGLTLESDPPIRSYESIEIIE